MVFNLSVFLLIHLFCWLAWRLCLFGSRDTVISVALVVRRCGADPCRCSPTFLFQFSPSTIHLADFQSAGFILSDLGTLLAFVGPCLSRFIVSLLLFRSRAFFFCLLCLLHSWLPVSFLSRWLFCLSLPREDIYVDNFFFNLLFLLLVIHFSVLLCNCL